MNTDRLAYSIAETGKLLGLGRSTIYAAIKAGDLKTCKAGRRTLITVEAVQKWISILQGSPASNATGTSANEVGHD